MVARNDITGDLIKSKTTMGKEFENNFERIFGAKKKEKYVPPPLPDWGDEDAEKRLDIIGANGPTGEHYKENEDESSKSND